MSHQRPPVRNPTQPPGPGPVLAFDAARRAKNTQFHIDAVEAAVAHFKRWPCITSINNIRNKLDDAERAFKSGEAG